MDNQIRSFMRVIRKLDNADDLIQSFPEWEKSISSQDEGSPTLAAQDQRRILDFPDPDTQATNIAKSSTLSKEDLLKRAAETPAQLSATEVALLKNRYWLEISSDEEHEVTLAHGLISGPHRVSEEEFNEADKRLKAMRHPLYAENEEKAIENAFAEHWRRENEAWRARQKQEAERSILARAAPWVRRLWDEEKGEKHWGYGIFVDPEAFADDEDVEDYMCRRDGIFFHGRDAIGAGSSAINNMWRLQRLQWPANITADDDTKDEKNNEDCGREKEGTDEKADDERAAKFQKLREYFISIRDRAPKRQRQERGTDTASTQAERGGLTDGILQNVFVVVDKASVDSVVSGSGLVDDMWVWAVEPDYDESKETLAPAVASEGSNSTEPASGYRGYMRVRLQQLVDKFYEARRFHENDYPMARLWEAAQKSKHHAFVSTKDDEARSWSVDRFVGSAMRAQPPRVMMGPKPVGSSGTGV
ncbi:hypothetical protein COL154_001299 [Colletotrichum chrysophilum]|uniref:uncharacterized protein n=1 Tax=Colletotrichum chrysophilum TaxID=1836956 RepID=UPI0023013872|nr:uncharacterized protein COL26b_003616 [Colletotrichum chrysophilum]KAJ0370918.1 hypothetical protein COL154_001299 [Colletotrichum chrysophilum]KAJ0378189.1 hypothetical protein COL26b_003616 [Colletotrichum chrysophilum]